MSGERSPGLKLVIVGLIIPLAMVYWLVSDRQHQARVAQQSVTAAWAGAQVVAGPVLVVPYVKRTKVSETVDGKVVERTVTKRARLYVTPSAQDLDTTLDPEVRTRGTIHRSVVYEAAIKGKARFVKVHVMVPRPRPDLLRKTCAHIAEHPCESWAFVRGALAPSPHQRRELC